MSDDDEYAMYIIVNNDLSMGKGKIAGQTAHGACGVTRILERQKPTSNIYKKWIENGEAKIVLKSTEDEMNKLLMHYTHSYKINKEQWCIAIRDLGKTQINPNSLTVIAFIPMNKNNVPEIIKTLKLL